MLIDRVLSQFLGGGGRENFKYMSKKCLFSYEQSGFVQFKKTIANSLWDWKEYIFPDTYIIPAGLKASFGKNKSINFGGNDDRTGKLKYSTTGRKAGQQKRVVDNEGSGSNAQRKRLKSQRTKHKKKIQNYAPSRKHDSETAGKQMRRKGTMN